MTAPGAELDPVFHVPARLRITVTLAALPDGDNLSFSRLQQLLGLTPGNLITHLRKLQDAGYVTNVKSRRDGTDQTSVSLTYAGRAALDRYTAVLRDLLDQAAPPSRPGSPQPDPRSAPPKVSCGTKKCLNGGRPAADMRPQRSPRQALPLRARYSIANSIAVSGRPGKSRRVSGCPPRRVPVAQPAATLHWSMPVRASLPSPL